MEDFQHFIDLNLQRFESTTFCHCATTLYTAWVYITSIWLLRQLHVLFWTMFFKLAERFLCVSEDDDDRGPYYVSTVIVRHFRNFCGCLSAIYCQNGNQVLPRKIASLPCCKTMMGSYRSVHPLQAILVENALWEHQTCWNLFNDSQIPLSNNPLSPILL